MVKLYVVGEVALPPKSVVVIAPLELFSEQFACEAFVNTVSYTHLTLPTKA